MCRPRCLSLRTNVMSNQQSFASFDVVAPVLPRHHLEPRVPRCVCRLQALAVVCRVSCVVTACVLEW